MTSELPAEFRPGSVLSDRFRIRKCQGEGGMASVLLADHVGLRAPVAIKVLKPEFARSSDVVTRFLREARSMARIANEHVVKVTDVGTGRSGTPYFVMEYLEGTDLSQLLVQKGPLPVDDVLDFALQALEGVAAAHRAGLVHRDLKPSNLFVVQRADDDLPQVKVLDFGISKHSAALATSAVELTKPATLLGSPYYMSPEQLVDARTVDVRTDVWSFGVLLYELLTNELPFDDAVQAVLIDAICSDPPVPIERYRADVPRDLVAVILRCLEKDRDDRYANVEELARALAPLARSSTSQAAVDRITRRRSSAPPPPSLADIEPAFARVLDESAPNAPTLPGAAARDTISTGPPTFSEVPKPALPARRARAVARKAEPAAGAAARGARGSRSRRASWVRTWSWLVGGLAVGLAVMFVVELVSSPRSGGDDDSEEAAAKANAAAPRPATNPQPVADARSAPDPIPPPASEPPPSVSASPAKPKLVVPARTAPSAPALAPNPAPAAVTSAKPAPSAKRGVVGPPSRELDGSNPFRRD